MTRITPSKTNSSIALGLILLCAAACGAGDTPTSGESAPVADVEANVERVPPQYEMHEKEASRPCPGDAEEACAHFVLKYPGFHAAVSPEVLAAFNQMVLETLLAPSFSEGPAASLEALEAEFFQAYDESVAEGFESRYFDERTVQVVHQEAGVLSLEFAHSSFYGGAHPNYARVYHVLDITTGQRLALGDLLIDGWKERFHTLGEAAFRKARELESNVSLEQEGFYFEGGTFQLTDNFAVVADGLFFFYSPYEVGPWVLGSTEFVIPWGDVGDLILAGGPLGALEE